MNGRPQDVPDYYQIIPAWTKSTEVRHPAPGELFAFIDEHSGTQMDAEFGNPPVASPYFDQNVWWDMPADRHNQGANLWSWSGRLLLVLRLVLSAANPRWAGSLFDPV